MRGLEGRQGLISQAMRATPHLQVGPNRERGGGGINYSLTVTLSASVVNFTASPNGNQIGQGFYGFAIITQAGV